MIELPRTISKLSAVAALLAAMAFTTAADALDATNSPRVNLTEIPLESSIILGNEAAESKIIIFTDVDCPYCRKQHSTIIGILQTRTDIAFYVKLFPLTMMHPDSYAKSVTIQCERSAKLLEDAMAGEKLPKTACQNGGKEIDENIALANKLGIQGAPVMILPDGKIARGFKEEKILTGYIEEIRNNIEEAAAFEAEAKKYRAATVKPELPEEARKYSVQAEAALKERRFEDAAALYAKVIAVAPWWPEAHFNRALILSEINRYEEAVRELKKYLLLKPEAKDSRAAQDKIYIWEEKIR